MSPSSQTGHRWRVRHDAAGEELKSIENADHVTFRRKQISPLEQAAFLFTRLSYDSKSKIEEKIIMFGQKTFQMNLHLLWGCASQFEVEAGSVIVSN